MLASMTHSEETPLSPDERLLQAKQMRALDGMRKKGTNAAAARAAGVSYSTISRWKAEDAEFQKAMHDAHEEHVDEAIEELHERAVVGDEQLVYFKGEPVPKRDPLSGEPMLDDNFEVIYYTRKVKSDPLLQFYLKSKRPEFREKTDLTLMGPDGGPVQTDNKVTWEFVLPDGKTVEDYQNEGQEPKAAEG
ncbi:terminase small subunit [Roseobacter phage RDJL Phi 2]|uniref:Terminase small subunit n=1 Tax=Roseobacter phage RDJL Phi 2 TaxID=1682380 RepID=A0A0K0PWQ6_9CAUD|nr:terminase small subunit [Roseobacter phage RDJL Phi 2]AKQ75843.1 hypothetical protein RDJLphi2_gp53 [Roseobacter phage RDJL Phi 2]